jgi:hypothetical protein
MGEKAVKTQLLLMLATAMIHSAFGQDQTKKPPKPFVEPTLRMDLAMFKGGLLLRDEGCARDFVKAQALEGVEKRKLLNEIVSLGCAVRVSSDCFSIRRPSDPLPAKSADICPVKAWERIDINKVIFRRAAIFGIQNSGWVLNTTT